MLLGRRKSLSPLLQHLLTSCVKEPLAVSHRRQRPYCGSDKGICSYIQQVQVAAGFLQAEAQWWHQGSLPIPIISCATFALRMSLSWSSDDHCFPGITFRFRDFREQRTPSLPNSLSSNGEHCFLQEPPHDLLSCLPGQLTHWLPSSQPQEGEGQLDPPSPEAPNPGESC